MKKETTKTKIERFTPNRCSECGQTVDFSIKLDRGSALIVLAIAAAVKRLGRNQVHLIEDMGISRNEIGVEKRFPNIVAAAAAGYMTERMVGNALRPKYFGLIAQIGGGSGEYLLTPRGARFLKGVPMPSEAIIDKTTHSKAYYRAEAPEKTFRELMKDPVFWDGRQSFLESLGEGFGEEEQPSLW